MFRLLYSKEITKRYIICSLLLKFSEIKEGMLADLCILDRNILEGSGYDLLNTKVQATYFNGQLVYENQ
ncbi:hypothetical protein [Alkalibacterium iburiense]|uniref:hypothetical protein n=1 Tax=Alkalibacterium iburiense TaxID=290589 RepID=UPI0031D54AF0